MVGPNRRIFEVSLLVVATINSFASPEISNSSNPLACEESFKDTDKLTLNETSLSIEIKNLMNTYTDWGKLLESVPLAIGGLGKLIIKSNQKMDFPGVDNTNLMKFPKKCNYPQSYRTSLLQISRQGNLAFLKAHKNMEKIRMFNSNMLSSHFNEVTRYVVSKRKFYIVNYPRNSLTYMKEVAVKSKELSVEVVKEFKIILELIEELIMTTKQMEQRRRHTQQIAERNKSLHFTKMYYREAIKALQSASNDLDKLKNAMTHLIEFYSKMSNFISQATVESEALVENLPLKYKNVSDDDEIFATLLDNVQKSNEASFLVHRVSDVYIDVSGIYIVEQMAHLDKMIKANASEVDLDRLQLELTWSTESDSEGIRHFIKADETLLREKLVERHNYIVNEYKWIFDCFSPREGEFKKL